MDKSPFFLNAAVRARGQMVNDSGLGTGLWANQWAAKVPAVGERKDRASPGASSRLQRWAAAVGPWQPLTGRGVASFRASSWPRLLAYQFSIALGSALIVVWTVRHVWLPPLERAIASLPDVAEIEGAQLHWPDKTSVRLAENPWLDLVVRPGDSSELGQTADLQLEFRMKDLRLNGLAGHVLVPYRPELSVPLGRIEATARWGAWRWVLVTALGFATGLCLWASWWLLATLYSLPAWILATVLGRRLGMIEAWRMATAALIPGSLFADWAVLSYGLGAVRLPGFVLLFSLHFVIGWLWLVWGVRSCPATREKKPENPFR